MQVTLDLRRDMISFHCSEMISYHFTVLIVQSNRQKNDRFKICTYLVLYFLYFNLVTFFFLLFFKQVICNKQILFTRF